MRASILLAGPALFLAACGSNNQADTTINADQGLSAESFSSNDVTAIDAVTGDASNMAADVNFVTEVDNSLGNDSAPSLSKSDSSRRPTRHAAQSNTSASAPAPAPTANTTAPAAATGNNAI
ncbi:MAG: hypothetical protein ACJ8E3_05920 [Sphingomicrobium sp.]